MAKPGECHSGLAQTQIEDLETKEGASSSSSEAEFAVTAGPALYGQQTPRRKIYRMWQILFTTIGKSPRLSAHFT